MSISTTVKIAGASILTAGLTAGVLLWNGGSTIDQAINTLEEKQTMLTQFKENETKFVNHINSLKDEVKELEEQLKNAPTQEEVDTLTKEIEELENLIKEAEKAEGDYTLHLESELNKANEDTERLQENLDKLSEVKPMTDEEINDLIGESSTEEPTEEPEEEFIELEYKRGVSERLEIVEGVRFFFTSPYYKFENRSDNPITYQVEGRELTTVSPRSVSTVQGVNSSETKIVVTTTINDKKYRITVIQ